MERFGLICLVLLSTPACKKKEAVQEAPPQPVEATAPAPSADAGAAEPPKVAASKKIEGFATPESVLYDAARDRYLVANINGKPVDKDDNGFISVVTPDGAVSNLKLIDGASPDFELNAPKGMAIIGNTLVVADVTAVRKFDVETGKHLASIEIIGSTFLGDVVPGKDGDVYVTDIGVTPEFKPNGTDAIYIIKADNTLEKFFAAPELGGPNGVLADGDDGVLVVTFGSGEFYRVNKEGKHAVVKAPAGALDGLQMLPDGRVAFSSWESKSIWAGPRTGPFVEIVKDVESPADFGLDDKRKRLLIPLFMKDAIVLQDL